MEINYFIPHAKGFTKIYRLDVEDLSHTHNEILNHPSLIQSYQYGLIKSVLVKHVVKPIYLMAVITVMRYRVHFFTS